MDLPIQIDEKELFSENYYLKRYFQYAFKNNFRQNVYDFTHFPTKEILPAADAYRFVEDKKPELFKSIRYHNKGSLIESEFIPFMESSDTTAFIVIKDDKLIFEEYFNGHSRESLSRVFSITKSFTSALIGIAIDQGLIKSVDDPIKKYLPEIKDEKTGSLTIRNLLLMQSGITFKEGVEPWTDDVKQYFSTDIKKRVLNLKTSDPVGEYFHYNDYYLQFLTMILERVSNKKAGVLLQEKIWTELGMEYPALMVVDSQKCNFEKMESGLCATAIDLAKFGRLYLNDGLWNDKSILSDRWIKESVVSDSIKAKSYYKYYQDKPWGRWFDTGKGYYKYLWWGYRADEETDDYFAMGILGQFIYISPRKKTIVVRLGKQWGISGWWPTIIKELIDGI
ncbi:serine hydrolase [Eubacteriaceae bacterium ES3]|nr:serine hydrolase [Eubacteriaceae bacterium ES3]